MEHRLSNASLNIFSAGFLKAYIITMRPYLLFISGITGIAGVSLNPNLDINQSILIFLASFLSYGFGQALTDCYQIDTDSISSPYRPLTQGILSVSSVLFVSIGGLVFCIAIFTVYNPINLLLGLLAGFGLYTYTYFKKRWWGGPFYNAWIVSCLCFMGYLCGGTNDLHSQINTLILLLLAVLFGYANFVLTGYFKDISADRQTRYFTLPVVFGRKISSITSDLFAILFILFAMSVLVNFDFSTPDFNTFLIIMFFISGIVYSFIAQYRLHKVRHDNEAFFAISPVIKSYVLLLSGAAAASRPDWAVMLLFFYAAFLIVLKIRPAENQI
jgi:4-hydroxybenzoate polyprenyltransferase